MAAAKPCDWVSRARRCDATEPPESRAVRPPHTGCPPRWAAGAHQTAEPRGAAVLPRPSPARLPAQRHWGVAPSLEVRLSWGLNGLLAPSPVGRGSSDDGS